MVTPDNQDQDKTQPVEPDEILDKSSGSITPRQNQQGVSQEDDQLFNEVINWVRDVFDVANRKMRM